MEYKIELIRLGKTQVELVKAISERGIRVDASELSLALSGKERAKYDLLREEAGKIIEEWKKG